MEANIIYNESCLETMKRMPDNFIDLVVTSPPYDNLRSYNDDIDKSWGESVWKPIIKEMYRVMAKDSVVVWVVGDAVIKGSETGSSFKQALFAIDCGFKLHDTMIFEKNSSTFPARRSGSRYTQIFEYMFVFVKGKVNSNLICDKANKWAGHTSFDGKIPPVPDFSPRNNIWKYSTSFNDKTSHPAVFPEQLVKDHILTWSEPGDLVYDPFSGSGTTAKLAKETGRKYLGSELSLEYYQESLNRIG